MKFRDAAVALLQVICFLLIAAVTVLHFAFPEAVPALADGDRAFALGFALGAIAFVASWLI